MFVTVEAEENEKRLENLTLLVNVLVVISVILNVTTKKKAEILMKENLKNFSKFFFILQIFHNCDFLKSLMN